MTQLSKVDWSKPIFIGVWPAKQICIHDEDHDAYCYIVEIQAHGYSSIYRVDAYGRWVNQQEQTPLVKNKAVHNDD